MFLHQKQDELAILPVITNSNCLNGNLFCVIFTANGAVYVLFLNFLIHTKRTVLLSAHNIRILARTLVPITELLKLIKLELDE